MAGKRIDETMKKEILETYGRGVTRKEIARQFGISLSSVGRILRGRRRQGETNDTAKEEAKRAWLKRFEQVQRRVRELENRILALKARRMG